ncbi:MAG: tetratricopeptide repeat protein [Planctomycetota bacterium]|nr:tetratricopeptide repeat protein [Planctomycetota bacterium]
MKRYVPDFIETNYRAGKYRGAFNCTAFFVDISGFTNLMETAFALGERGAEIMSRQLRRVFDPPVNAVLDRGGIITGFAGDSFIALFPDDAGERARSAASDIVRYFALSGRDEGPDGVFDFKVKCGIDAGKVRWGITRDSLGRCAYYFHGSPINGAAAAAVAAPITNVQAEDMKHGEVLTAPLPDPERQGVGQEREAREDVLRAFIQDEILTLGERAEIRPVASVFMSFVRATSDAGLFPVSEHDDIGRIMSLVRDEAISCGGTFNKLDFGDKGTTTLCFFGAPKGGEKPVVAALSFAERVRGRLREEEKGKYAVIQVRTGVDAGLAYSGTTGGERRNEWTCLGDCVNTSARLMTAAGWDEILVSPRVRESGSRDFEFASLGELQLKGKARPEAVFSCERAAPRASAWRYGQAMVGRKAELARLQELLRPAETGRFAGMVYVFGESGAGKSRLAQEFRNGLDDSERHYHWLHMPCLENDGGLKPIAVWLERFFDVDAFDSQEKRRAKVDAAVDRIARRATTPEETRIELRRAVSFLASLVHCGWDGSLFSQVADTKLRYENQLWAVKELIKALATESPLVLEIEDSHWMEPCTAEWVKIMTRNVPDVPFMILLTSRYEAGEAGALPILECGPASAGARCSDGGDAVIRGGPDALRPLHKPERKPYVPVGTEVPIFEIELCPFAAEEVTELFEGQVGAKPDAALVQFLMERTEGNPFFAEQLSAHLRDSDLLAQSPDGMQMKGELGRLPATLDSLLLARFDRLEARLREGLKHAATLGVRFLRGVLEELLRRSREFSGEADDVVPAAEGERMIVPQSTALEDGSSRGADRRLPAAGEVAPGDKGRGTDAARGDAKTSAQAGLTAETAYLFRHVLMQKTAYHLQLPSVRAYLHRLAGEVIEELFPESKEFYAELADHYGKAQMPEKEIEYLEKAAKYAEHSYKNSEAIELFSRLIARLAESRSGADQARIPQSAIRTARARYGLAAVYKLVGKWTQAIEEYEKLLALAGEEVSRSQAPDPQAVELIVHGRNALASMYKHRGQLTEAMAQARLALGLAESAGSVSGKATVVGNIGTIHFAQGEYDRAMECYREWLQLSDELGSKVDRASAIGCMGVVYQNQGDYTRAIECHQKWVRLAEELGDRAGKAMAIGNMGTIFRNQGDYARAMECQRERLRVAEELGDKAGKAMTLGNMGIIYRHQGDYVCAMECLRKDLQLAEELGNKAGQAAATGNMGNVYFNLGDHARAMECYQRWLSLAEELGDKSSVAHAVGNIGGLSALMGEHARAMECHQRCLQLAEELGSMELKARAISEVGSILAKTGDCAAAVEKQKHALRLYRELNARPRMSWVLVLLAEAYLGLGRGGVAARESEGGRPASAGSSALPAGRSEIELAREALKEARAIAEEFKQKKPLEDVERLEKLIGDNPGRS